MKKNQKQAFTLVELIVVIIILAILGTIAFISLQGYSKSARDSRRVSDIANIKTSLELFILNSGFYPQPDVVGSGAVYYSGDLLWTQGTVGNNVAINLSKNLQNKPIDPLFDIEYTYSLANSKKEYQLMALYEGDISKINNIISASYATNIYKTKVEGNYNEVFLKTSKYIIPIPSLIISETLPVNIFTTPLAINSMIITSGENMLDLGIPGIEKKVGGLAINLSVYTGTLKENSPKTEKEDVIRIIQAAYDSTSLASSSLYANILNTTDLEIMADRLILARYDTVASPIVLKTVFDCENSGDILYGTESGTDILLTCDNDIIICSGNGIGYTINACNLGTDILGTTSDSFGHYFQFGKTISREDGSWNNGSASTQYDWKASSGTDSGSANDWGVINTERLSATYQNSTGENQTKMQGPCATGYHVPTKLEWSNIISLGGWSDGADISSVLKMPMSAAYVWNGSMGFPDTGMYWTSSPDGAEGKIIYFGEGFLNINSNSARSYGCNVRCIKN